MSPYRCHATFANRTIASRRNGAAGTAANASTRLRAAPRDRQQRWPLDADIASALG